MPGVGKTFWGKKWADKNGLGYVDLDEEIRKVSGMKISQLFRIGEGHFRLLERDILLRTCYIENFIIACGGGVAAFYNNMEWMKRHGEVIYLEDSEENILERVDKGSDRPIFNGLKKEEIGEKLHELRVKREKFYKRSDIIWNVNSVTSPYNW